MRATCGLDFAIQQGDLREGLAFFASSFHEDVFHLFSYKCSNLETQVVSSPICVTVCVIIFSIITSDF